MNQEQKILKRSTYSQPKKTDFAKVLNRKKKLERSRKTK